MKLYKAKNPCNNCEHFCEYEDGMGNGRGVLHLESDEQLEDKTIICFIPTKYWCNGMVCGCKAWREGYSCLIYIDDKRFKQCSFSFFNQTNLEIPFWTIK